MSDATATEQTVSTIGTATVGTQTQQTTTNAAVEPYYKGWLKSDGSLDHAHLDRLPDDLKGLKDTLGRQKNFDDVLRVMQNQQVLNGKKALAPLPADAPDDAKTARKQLLDSINGVPKEAKDYRIAKPEGFDEKHWNPALVDGFSAWAHKNSISPAAAQELVAMQLGTVTKQLSEQANYETQFWANEAKAFDGVIRQENIASDRANALVEKGAIALGLDMESEKTKMFLKGADARLMAMRHALAIGEDKFVQGDSKGGEADPGALAQDIQRNPSNPLYAVYRNVDGKYPQAQVDAARERVNELLRQSAAKRSNQGRG